MFDVKIRPAELRDLEPLALLRAALWPESSASEHAAETRPLLDGTSSLPLPLTIFVAEAPDGRLIGFVEVDLRSHADGCDPAQPVGFLEGWFVAEDFRQLGIGGGLVAIAEEWARTQGWRRNRFRYVDRQRRVAKCSRSPGIRSG